jgi:hypothetical protein
MRRQAAAAIVFLLATACTASDQPGLQGLTVTTTPPGATCTISRDAATLARIAATRATLAIAQGKTPLTVTCGHPPDHKNANATLAPHYIGGAFDTMLGGITGGPAAIDYAYPAEIHLDLPPGPPDLAPNPPVPVTATPLAR